MYEKKFQAHNITSSLYEKLLNDFLESLSSLWSSLNWKKRKVEDITKDLYKSRFVCEAKRVKIEKYEKLEELLRDEIVIVRNENKQLVSPESTDLMRYKCNILDRCGIPIKQSIRTSNEMNLRGTSDIQCIQLY